MKKATLAALALASSFVLTGCGGDKVEKTNDPAAYKKCIETEAAKFLDETGSNLEFANGKAAKACEALK